MDSNITSMILLVYLCFTLKTISAQEKGYLVSELPDIACNDPSNVISQCSGLLNHKIADLGSILPSNVTSKLADIKRIILQLYLVISSQECIDVGKKYLCELAYPYRCFEKYYGISDEINARCTKARAACSSHLNVSYVKPYLDCARIGNKFLKDKIPREPLCVSFPVVSNDPYSCEINFKVFEGTYYKLARKEIIEGYEKLKENNINDIECKKNVSGAVCKANIPACSEDKKKRLALLSKQDCHQMVGCVNKTRNATLISEVYGMCDQLPDGTAKTFSLVNADEDNKKHDGDKGASSRTIALSAIMFIAVPLAQHFS